MLRELRLRDFRCFSSVSFRPEAGLNLLLGDNAQGKTSLLEAACVLLRLQSPRTSSLIECVRFGHDAFSLDGHWDESHLRLKWHDGRRAMELDSKIQNRSTDYLAIARVAWISNDDLDLIRGGGSRRRRYLDFLGAQVEPGYLRHLRVYERALRCRNALLKEGESRSEIDAFNPPLIESGTHLMQARERFCQTLTPLGAQAYSRIAEAAESLALRYRPGFTGSFEEALAASRAEETRLRQTVVGPHRDDLELTLDERRADTFASEGQQRSIALALKLAQASALAAQDRPPLYLIDDVFGELDARRRNNLMAILPADAQKLVTSTSMDWLKLGDHAACFRIAAATVTRES